MQQYVRKSGHKVFGFQFMHPLWDATAKFKHYLAIHHLFMQSYLIVTSIPYFSLIKIIKAICYKNRIERC